MNLTASPFQMQAPIFFHIFLLVKCKNKSATAFEMVTLLDSFYFISGSKKIFRQNALPGTGETFFAQAVPRLAITFSFAVTSTCRAY
jgi:hypothetical protein